MCIRDRYTRKDVEEKKETATSSGNDELSPLITRGLGGKQNISDVDCCITRLRCTVKTVSYTHLKPISETMKGKLPQRKLVTTAAAGYSSYGNQIGLATGLVREIYHPGYVAKRMEVGAVIAAADVYKRQTCAFAAVGVDYVRDIDAGEIVVIDHDGVEHSIRTHCKEKRCV